MSDIFVSYARDDLAWVERLVPHLEQAGFSVWWDERLRIGDPFDDVIQRKIDEARIVLVLWSANSVDSTWVKAEASAAQRQDKLVPLLIEPVPIPMPFTGFHTADLTGWDGAPAYSRLLALLRSLLDRLSVIKQTAHPNKASERHRDVTEWHATLLVSEPRRRCFLLRIGTRRHELECQFRPNYLWNRFVVIVDALVVARGGHQYQDQKSFDFALGDDWVGHVQLACGSTIASGELLGRCVVSVGGRILYREPEND